MSNVLIVDAANVVGSVPDGWWRDRRGAAERLRDRLASREGSREDDDEEIILVVEGAARDVGSVPGVRVEAAPVSGQVDVDRAGQGQGQQGGRAGPEGAESQVGG
ncbi:hypothetical protein ACFXAG_35945, partial [Streptomyces yangpuensis]